MRGRAARFRGPGIFRGACRNFRGLEFSPRPEISSGASENHPLAYELPRAEIRGMLKWAVAFAILEVLSVRKGTATLSATMRTMPVWVFVPLAIWFAGHVLLRWPVPFEEDLCRKLRAAQVRGGGGL